MLRIAILLLLTLPVLAADARDEYKRRAAAVTFWDAPAHFKLALWCERKGLTELARSHHEQVLEREPDHRASRRALGYRRAGAEWVRPGAAADTLRQVLKDLESQSIDTRRRAVRTAGRLLTDVTGARVLPPLYHRALEDRDESVRHAAVAALRKPGERGRLRPFLRALYSPSAMTRLHAIDALGRMGDRAAAGPLLRRYRIFSGVRSSGVITTGVQRSFIQDFDVEVG